VFFVLVVHPRENLTNITLGGQPERLGLALAIAAAAVVLVVALNAWATWFSLRNRRAVQVALDTFEAPIRKLALHNLAPGQHYKESDISPYHWVNGAPPKPEESPEYHRLLQDGWRDWRLEVGGLVGQPLPLRHGAPLRLRVETQLGYKMVKYLRSIELIQDYRTEGDGQGGSREDAQFFGRGAEI